MKNTSSKLRDKDPHLKITVNAMRVSTGRTVLYVLAGLGLLLAAYFLFYNRMMYYLLQLFLEWAYLIRFIVLAAAVFGLFYLFQYLEKKLFGSWLQLEADKGFLVLRSARKSDSVPLNALKWIVLTQKNGAYTGLEVQADQSLYYSPGTWSAGCKDPQFQQFRDWLKGELQQKGFQYHAENARQRKLTVMKEIFCPDYNAYLRTQQKKKRRLIYFVIGYFVVVIAVVAYLVTSYGNDGISILDGEKIGSSYFEKYQNQVYFLRVGDGYFPLREADPGSFTALETNQELYSSVGADKEHVYWQDHSLPWLQPAAAIYLGGDYTKDAKHVYFRDQLISGADAASFQSVKHSEYNTAVYYYGQDKHTVYYQATPLRGLQPSLVQSFDNSARYIKDTHTVFYKDTRLPELDVAKTIVYDSEKYRAAYATDGRHHYLDELPMPSIAVNKYWGTTTINHNNMKLLIPSGQGSYLFLFGDDRHLYFYDEERREMVMVYTFDQRVALTPLDKGRFTDGKNVYTVTTRKIRTRSRTIQTTHGYQMKVLRLNASAEQRPVTMASYASPVISW